MVKNEQKHGVPALASFFFPGLGQAIKGHWAKAIITFIAFWGSVLAMFLLIGFILAPIVWIVGICDAYNSNSTWEGNKK